MRGAIVGTAVMLAALAAGSGAAQAQQGYCDSMARDYANRMAGSSTAGGALAGGAMGAIGGAVLGGIIDGNRGAANGAAIGGGAGALVGAGQGQQKWRSFYDQAYNDCMVRASANRPPPPPPPGYAGQRPPPPPGQYYGSPRPPQAYGAPPQAYGALPQAYAAPRGYGAPPAWSREWYAYCAQRYRSFDPNSGYFIASGGVRKFCR